MGAALASRVSTPRPVSPQPRSSRSSEKPQQQVHTRPGAAALPLPCCCPDAVPRPAHPRAWAHAARWRCSWRDRHRGNAAEAGRHVALPVRVVAEADELTVRLHRARVLVARRHRQDRGVRGNYSLEFGSTSTTVDRVPRKPMDADSRACGTCAIGSTSEPAASAAGRFAAGPPSRCSASSKSSRARHKGAT